MNETPRRRSPHTLRLMLILAVWSTLALPVAAAVAAEPEGFAGGFGMHGAGIDHGGVTITSVAGSSIGLTTEDGWTRTITVTPQTTITRGGQSIKVTDLSVGDTIGFRQTRNDDGTYTVTAIVVATPKAGGEVTAVADTSVTVKARDGSTRVITVNGSTTYLVGKDPGTKADVTVGSRIMAQGSVSGDTFTATQIRVQPAMVGGEVTAKTADSITVKRRDGTSSTIHLGAATTYKVRGKDAATLADIAVGDLVIATGKARADGSLDASHVRSGKSKMAGHGWGGRGWGGFMFPGKPEASPNP